MVVTGGQVVVSGTGANGTTVEQFFDYVANAISLGRPRLMPMKHLPSSRTIHLYETRPRLFTDLASEVTSAVNHQFPILPDPSTGCNFVPGGSCVFTYCNALDDQTLFPLLQIGIPLEAVVGNWVAIEEKGLTGNYPNLHVPKM